MKRKTIKQLEAEIDTLRELRAIDQTRIMKLEIVNQMLVRTQGWFENLLDGVVHGLKETNFPRRPS